MLLPRVLTAIVGIPFLLYLIHAGGLCFSLFIVAVAARCLHEYGLILTLGGRPTQRVNAVVLGGALAACLSFRHRLVPDAVISLICARCSAVSTRSTGSP